MTNACGITKAAIIGFLASVVFPSVGQADWVTDFVDRATVTTTQASSFESNGRHYATAGGASMRWSSSADYPVSINPPRLGGGCGGIDAYLGGVSFLDEEYLVQKIEAIITNAPAIAFDIAMKQMSSQLSETYKSFESITNGLNALQLDDCGIANAGVVTVMKENGSFSDAGEKMWAEATTGFKTAYDASAKNRDAARSTLNIQPVGEIFAACTSADYIAFMNENGSLLEKAANDLGLMNPDKTGFLRAAIGDITMVYDMASGVASGGGAYSFVAGECGGTTKGLGAAFSRYVNEGIYVVKGDALGSACAEVADNTIQTLLQSAITKFLASPQGVLTDRERNAVYMTGLPLDIALKAAETDGSLGIFQESIVTSLPIMYSYNMFRQEISEYSSMLIRLKQFLSEAMAGTDANQCPRAPAELLVMEISKAEQQVQKQYELLASEYRQQLEIRGVDPIRLRQQIQDLIDRAVRQKHRMLRGNKD